MDLGTFLFINTSYLCYWYFWIILVFFCIGNPAYYPLCVTLILTLKTSVYSNIPCLSFPCESSHFIIPNSGSTGLETFNFLIALGAICLFEYYLCRFLYASWLAYWALFLHSSSLSLLLWPWLFRSWKSPVLHYCHIERELDCPSERSSFSQDSAKQWDR